MSQTVHRRFAKAVLIAAFLMPGIARAAPVLATSGELVILADFQVKPHEVEAFAAAIDRHAARSRKELEVLAFEVTQDPKDPAHFTLWEMYRDAAARERHRSRPSSRNFWPIATPMLVKQANGDLFTVRELRRRKPVR